MSHSNDTNTYGGSTPRSVCHGRSCPAVFFCVRAHACEQRNTRRGKTRRGTPLRNGVLLTALAVLLVSASSALAAAPNNNPPLPALPPLPGAPATTAASMPGLPDAGGTPAMPAMPGTGKPAAPGALPEIGDLLAVVDKATAGEPGGPPSDYSAPIKLAIVFTALAALPAALMMMTSFTRIIIVLSFVRRALTTQNIPPTVAIVGLALFLTIFTMAPTFSKVNADAIQPYLAETMTFEAAAGVGMGHMKDFMIRQTRQSDLSFFLDLAKAPAPKTAADVPAHVAVPAFAISEFRTAFEMGCLLFIPFLLIDLVVSGILLSAGMMMLPPAIISLPFKIILFVLVDGWRLLAQSLVMSFN